MLGHGLGKTYALGAPSMWGTVGEGSGRHHHPLQWAG